MKILITTASYYPHLDGVQKVTQYQAEGLVKLGHEVTVITSDRQGQYSKKEIHNGVKIIRVNAYNKNMQHFGDKLGFQNLVKQLASNVDVMMNVSLESFAADWVLPIMDSIPCRKVLMNHGMHDFVWNKQNISSGKEFAKKILRDVRWLLFYQSNWKKICKYDEVIFLHEQDCAYKYFAKRKYLNRHVIYNAVDPEFFLATSELKQNNIINVGTYNKRKNQLECLKAFYKADTKDYSLTLIGNPDNEYYRMLIEESEKLSQKYGNKKVEILCNVPRQETIERICASEIYLMTSTWEAFPISLIESMAAGDAYISTNVGIVKYLPGGKICEEENELVQSISSLIDGEWSQLAEKGHEYAVKNFSQIDQVKKLEEVLMPN